MERRAWAEIVDLVLERQDANHVLLNAMIDIRDRYNGEYVLPWFTDESIEDAAIAIPSLVAEAVDNLSMRAGSVLPAIWCPALDPSKQKGTKSREFAEKRRKSIAAGWHESKLSLQLRRLFRHYFGYGTCTLIVQDTKDGPRYQTRDPLTTYPDLQTAEDLTEHENVAMVYGKSGSWLRARFPQLRKEFGGVISNTESSREAIWDVCEWVDRWEWRVGLLGPRDPNAIDTSAGDTGPQDYSMELWWKPNALGRVPIVTPARVTLDRIVSTISHTIPMIDLMAKLQTLDLVATEKAIFPDRFVIARPGETPMVLSESGTFEDGRTGVINQLKGVEQMGEMRSEPSQSNKVAIDRIERNIRVSSGLVPQMGGETYGALRTGRGIDALMGAAIDPRINEAQETVGMFLEQANEFYLQTMRDEYAGQKFWMFTGQPGDAEEFEFDTDRHVETLRNAVSYPIAGADVGSTNIHLGQMLAADAISMRTFRERHPWVLDPVSEERRVQEEALERTAIQALQTQAAQGAVPLEFLALLEEEVRNRGNADIFEAIGQAMRKLREQQVQEAPPPEEGQVMAPEAAPGLAAGPNAMTQLTPGEVGGTIPRPSEDQDNLRRIISALNAGAGQAGAVA